ncbi:hypothetical protein CDAR_548811 [Caerostris darwini]|uniref:Uncharacterized protein n=1 Tax=Caerostris darwini TaxID=1538125 RepID=A0AAV4WKW6_9ARAC|nr:hypothetical protein CDAR_548811 [Caerostris darwini]
MYLVFPSFIVSPASPAAPSSARKDYLNCKKTLEKKLGRSPPHPSESPQLPPIVERNHWLERREGDLIELWIPPLQSPSSLDGHCPPAVLLLAGAERLLRFLLQRDTVHYFIILWKN